MLAVRGWPTWREVFWLIVAMVGARSAAMTFNRIADRNIDALNPRTRMRALPAGRLTLPLRRGLHGIFLWIVGAGGLGTQPASPSSFLPWHCGAAALFLYEAALPCFSHLVGIATDSLHRCLDCPAQ